ncbi:hypothetical protein IF2G_10743 [Cordyceps javanica]|nr:hypothetical protein IF2G_10743 [Cordyceps javanica]
MRNAERTARQLGWHSFHQAEDINMHIAHEPAAVNDARQGGEFDQRTVDTASVVGQRGWNMYAFGRSCQTPSLSSAFRIRKSIRVSTSSSCGTMSKADIFAVYLLVE